MNKKIKPGRLCLIVGMGTNRHLNGKVVTVLRKTALGEVYIATIRGAEIVGREKDSDRWLCEWEEPVAWHFTGRTLGGKQFTAFSSPKKAWSVSSRNLLPLNDPDADLSSDKEEGLGRPKQLTGGVA